MEFAINHSHPSFIDFTEFDFTEFVLFPEEKYKTIIKNPIGTTNNEKFITKIPIGTTNNEKFITEIFVLNDFLKQQQKIIIPLQKLRLN